MGDDVVSSGSGDFVFLPTNQPHRFTNFGTTMSTWVTFYSHDSGKTTTALKKPAKYRQSHSYKLRQAALETDPHDAIKRQLLLAIRGSIHAARHQRQCAQGS